MMAKNPYETQSPMSFWSTGVRAPLDQGLDLSIAPSLSKVSKDMAICSAGSCFAQYVGSEFSERGFNYLKSDFSGHRIESFGVGNVYTTTQMRQWIDFALGNRAWSDLSTYEGSDGFYDYLLPHLPSLSSRDQIEQRRQSLGQEILCHLTSAGLFVFTLGLTETWRNDDQDVYPTCPGTIVGEFNADAHFFENMQVQNVVDDLEAIERLLRKINPELKLLLTVSPVPLTATATSEHVITATTRSKSILRAAVSEYVDGSKITDYFPSYELVTHNTVGDWRFDENLRSISKKGVDFVMAHAFGRKPQTNSKPASAQNNDTVPVCMAEQDETHCEEEMLEAFNRSQMMTKSSSEIFLIGDSHFGKIASAMETLQIPYHGGMIMNGSGFSDGKFELCDRKIFKPTETPEALQIWNKLFDVLEQNGTDNLIYTNIGFQTHRTISQIANHYQSMLLTQTMIADYFSEVFHKQRDVLNRMKQYGKVILVEDPNLYSFIGGNRTDTIVCTNYNFDIYCQFMRNLAQENDWEYFKPGEDVLCSILKDTKSISAAFSDDTFHGSDLYYRKLAEVLIANKPSRMGSDLAQKAA